MSEHRDWFPIDFRKDIRIARDPLSHMGKVGFQIWLLGDKGTSCAEPPTFKKMEEGAMLPDPTFKIEGEEIQWLMDALWKSGVRPSEVGTAGHLSATQEHLEDMRRLVFDKDYKPIGVK